MELLTFLRQSSTVGSVVDEEAGEEVAADWQAQLVLENGDFGDDSC